MAKARPPSKPPATPVPQDQWSIPDTLWGRIEPLLPCKPRRFCYPGRKPFDDRLALQGILFVLHTGIGWEHLPRSWASAAG